MANTDSNNAKVNVFLFDVDGVLVDPIAYKVGIKKSIELLCKMAGIKSEDEALAPSDEEIAFMESCGIHDVWDMTNIVFACIFAAVQDKYRIEIGQLSFESEDMQAILKGLCALKASIERPSYRLIVHAITALDPQAHAPDTMLRTELGRKRKTKITDLVMNGFLQSTRSVKSYGTRIFQNIILGTAEFESTYNLPSVYDGSSLLKSEDKVLLSQRSLSQLNELRKRSEVKMAVYTARPSQVPPDIEAREGYSPEAEIGAESAGLLDLPLVGMGMMEWLAAKHNERTEDLTKPNMTHSLSALLAAVLQDNTSSTLELAHSFERDSSKQTDLTPLKDKHINVYVFEDTSSGIKPLQQLAGKLNSSGYLVEVTALGVARHEEKIHSLQALCQRVFPDINEALNYVLPRLS